MKGLEFLERAAVKKLWKDRPFGTTIGNEVT